MLLLNAVENAQGFGEVSSRMTVLTASGEILDWPELTKPVIAKRLVKLIAQKLGLAEGLAHCSLSEHD